MGRKESFTFRQTLLSVAIACSIVFGLSLKKGFSFYEKPENIGVILVVVAVAIGALTSKWRKGKLKNNEKK